MEENNIDPLSDSLPALLNSCVVGTLVQLAALENAKVGGCKRLAQMKRQENGAESDVYREAACLWYKRSLILDSLVNASQRVKAIQLNGQEDSVIFHGKITDSRGRGLREHTIEFSIEKLNITATAGTDESGYFRCIYKLIKQRKSVGIEKPKGAVNSTGPDEEKAMADKLAVVIKNHKGKTVFSDFTLLSLSPGKVIYTEISIEAGTEKPEEIKK